MKIVIGSLNQEKFYTFVLLETQVHGKFQFNSSPTQMKMLLGKPMSIIQHQFPRFDLGDKVSFGPDGNVQTPIMNV